MSNQVRALAVVLAIALSGCLFFDDFGRGFSIGSAAPDPVSYAFADPPSSDFDPTLDPTVVSGVTGVGQRDCVDLHSFLLILDGETGA